MITPPVKSPATDASFYFTRPWVQFFDALVTAPAYQLPVASSNTLGGVKAGEGVTIDADGVLTVTQTEGASKAWVAANYVTFPGFGVTSSTACVGNDARLSDARPASDVYAWAKAATKPIYTAAEVGAQPVNTDTSGICGVTTLTGGMYVNIYNNSGVKTIRPADWTDNTKQAHGFVESTYTVGQTVTVYLPGSKNIFIPVGSFVASDVGKTLYLGANGSVTLLRPRMTGNLEQKIGIIDDIAATISSTFIPDDGITVR